MFGNFIAALGKYFHFVGKNELMRLEIMVQNRLLMVEKKQEQKVQIFFIVFSKIFKKLYF